MTEPLRRAGRGLLPDGATVRWSVAEGARGRRWRWTVLDGSDLRHVGLVEIDAAGRFARLELETAAGMLTLHPDPGRTRAHGNVVTSDGVRPLDMPWRDGWSVRIAADAFGSALLAGTAAADGIAIDADLVVTVRAARPADTEAARMDLALDPRGVPRLADAVEWPLEI